jgi:hypothetical protein
MSVSCGQHGDGGLGPFDCEFLEDRAKLKFYGVLDGGLFCKSGEDFSKYVSRYMNDEDEK